MVLVYLVVCFFVFLAGFVDSIAGGGGLISLPAYMIAGLPVHTAIATNKMSSSMGTFVASFHYMKKGFMKWKICIPAVFGAIAGSWIGSHLALLISEKALKIAMLVVLPVILFYVLRSKALKGKDENATEVINGMLIFKSILIAVKSFLGRCSTDRDNRTTGNSQGTVRIDTIISTAVTIDIATVDNNAFRSIHTVIISLL